MCHVHLSKHEEVEACFGYCPTPDRCYRYPGKDGKPDLHVACTDIYETQLALDAMEGRFGHGPGFCWFCAGPNQTVDPKDSRACKGCEEEMGPGLDYQGARIEGVEPTPKWVEAGDPGPDYAERLHMGMPPDWVNPHAGTDEEDYCSGRHWEGGCDV